MLLSNLLQQHSKDQDYQLIGKGGFGRVFKVFHHLDNQVYAIKQIRVSEENITHALREIRILASICHPHVIRYFYSWVSSLPCDEYNHDEDDEDDEETTLIPHHGNYYFFNIQMEYCPSDLRSFLRDRKTINFHHCFDMISQTTDGLAFLHSQSIIHRDLKPENILIYSLHPLQIRITDFGLSRKIVFQEDKNASCYAGSCLYAAPEQLHDKKFSFASDVFSLGVIAYEIQFLFYTDMERIRSIEILKNQRRADCAYYRDLILEMTNPDEYKRPSIVSINKKFINLVDPVVFCRDLVWHMVMSAMENI